MAERIEPRPTLRDDLALERTVLANERTLLAYLRTAVALLLTGVSAMHLPGLHPDPAFGDGFYYTVGGTLIGLGALAVLIGYYRFRQVKAQIEAAPARGLPDPPPD